jgi:hypothetical protein
MIILDRAQFLEHVRVGTEELTTVDDFFHNGGVVLTTEAEAKACHLGTLLRRGPADVKAV